jgi:endonuclease YncB( thermonuclease family)
MSGPSKMVPGALAVLLVCALAVIFFPHPAQSQARFLCPVTSVHDGDTLRCADGRRVRLAAIAAREIDGNRCQPGHPCPRASAQAARAALSRLASGRRLVCVRDGTSFNRTVGWCRLPDGRDLSCAMVATGTVLRWPRHDPTGRLLRCQ